MQNKIASNAIMLLFLQLASYAVPFLLLPYLSRVLENNAFGELSVLWAISAYVGIIADFGFYLWASREASLQRLDKSGLSKLYSAVTVVKITLCLMLLIPMIALSLLFNAPMLLYLFMWITVFGQSLVPVWLYQGTQKVAGYLIFSLLAQMSSAILTLLTVHSSEALIFVTASSALSWGAVAILSNRDVLKKFELSFEIPSKTYLKNVLLGAWHLFIANVAVSYYINLPAIALSLFASKIEVGIFMGAQKIIFALQALFTPVSSAVFPLSSTLAKEDINAANSFAKRLIFFTAIIMLIATWLLGSFSEEIVALVLGKNFKDSAEILAIMSIGPIFVALSVIISNHILIVRGHAARLKNLYFVIAVISTILSYPIIRDFHAKGAGWLYVIVEFIVFIGLVWLARDIKNNDELKN